MFAVRPLKTFASFRIALTGMLLLLLLAGPAPGRAYAAPVLSADLGSEGGVDGLADLPSELAGPQVAASALSSGTAHVPAIDMGIADTGLTATLGVLEEPVTSTVQFSSSAYDVAEDAGSALITVTLTPTSSFPVTVTYATSAGTATAGSDYDNTSGSLTFDPGEDSETISVSITNDLLDEADETLTLTLSDPVSATLGTPVTATLTIVDNDLPPTVQFDSTSYSVDEDAGPATITVTLNAASGLTVAVDYAVSGGTATAGQDYVAASGTLTVAPGLVSQTLSVTIIADVFDEDDETVNLSLANPTYATPGTTTAATLTIVDDDDAPTVQFDAPSYTVDEEAGLATITVTLSAPSSRAVSVGYATSDGTATAGSDYAATAGSLNFPPAQVSVTATLERLTLTSGYSPPSPDPSGLAYVSHLNMLLISDGEVEEIPALWEGANLFGTALSGTLIYTGTTYGGANWDFSDEPTGVAYNPTDHHLYFTDDTGQRRVYEVGPGSDGEYDTGDDVFSSFRTGDYGNTDPEGICYGGGYLFTADGVGERVYQIAPGANHVFDGVPASGGDDVVAYFDTHRLNIHNPESVEFDLHTGHLYVSGDDHSPLAEATTDGKLIRYIGISFLASHNPAGLAYAPSSTDPSQWHLYLVDRGVDNNTNPNENDGKMYELSFPPGETVLTFTVPITDDITAEGSETVNLTLSDPVSATLGQSSATLTIVDTLPSVQFDPASYSVGEGAGSAAVTATLSGPAAFTVTVDYATSAGTATAGDDYIAASGTLTFPAGTVAQTIDVTIVDDALDEPAEETVNLALSNPGNAELGTPTAAVLRIQDNDPQPTVGFSTPVFEQAENGVKAFIVVELSAPSALSVTVDYATSDGTATAGSDYIAASGTLTFEAGTTSQSFSVSILDDLLDEPDETVNLTLSNASNAVLGVPTTTLTINDNDGAPTVQFSGSSYSVAEGGGTATITVTLSAQSAQPVAVQYATGDGTATAGSDYTGTSGLLTFTPGQTVRTFTVAITDDGIAEPDETVNLALSSPTNAVLGTQATATLTILDDDGQPTVAFGAASYSASEGSGQASITVRLSHLSASAVSVGYGTSDGTAVAGVDYQAATGTLTFAPGVTEQSFSVTIIDDLLDEENETLGLALSAPSNATLGTPSSATLTIVDDDNPPTVQFSDPSYSVGESVGSATIMVTLSGASGKAISVDYATSDGTAVAGSDYVATAGTLTFAVGETVQTFTVTIIDDLLNEENETLSLALSSPSSTVILGSPSSATLTIVQDVFRVYLPGVFRNH
jgi:hypothetical protein